jgi:peptide/nickel transport system permease protein
MSGRGPALILSAVCFGLLLIAALSAPEHMSAINPEAAFAGPLELPPLGADEQGRSLVEYAAQGAAVVLWPAMAAGLLVSLLGVAGGLLRSAELSGADAVIRGLGEVVGSLPRMVVILVVALIVPKEAKGLLPLALTWAILAAPGAMDEAAAVAERLGGARFVEALRAHGYSAVRIYLYHIVALNLRPVVVRQGAETMMQVVFLEIALSYLALAQREPSFTHPDGVVSWANLLKMGYPALVLGMPTLHALVLALVLIGMVAVLTLSLSRAARAR